MIQKWENNGFIFKPNGTHALLHSNTTPVSAVILDNIIRIYYSARSKPDNNNNFISYDWENGMTLYSYNSIDIYNKFLSEFKNLITESKKWKDIDSIKKFYIE